MAPNADMPVLDAPNAFGAAEVAPKPMVKDVLVISQYLTNRSYDAESCQNSYNQMSTVVAGVAVQRESSAVVVVAAVAAAQRR